MLANDTDPDGDPLAVALDYNLAHGTLTLRSDGSFTYIPEPDFHAVDAFTYYAYNARQDDTATPSNVVSGAITVNPINDAPTANDDLYATDEDTPLIVPVPGVLENDTDAEGDSLSVVLVDSPANGTVTLDADGSFTYTPNSGFNGVDSFTYRASDGTAQSNLATVTIEVGSGGHFASLPRFRHDTPRNGAAFSNFDAIFLVKAMPTQLPSARFSYPHPHTPIRLFTSTPPNPLFRGHFLWLRGILMGRREFND